jgi:hypothetical protein
VRRWPEIRAGLIAAAIFFGLVDGCPIPPPNETLAWQKSIVEPVRAVRDVVRTPVAWIEPTLRVSQRWALYQAPGGPRYRMSIEGQARDGSWQILYRAADPLHDEDAPALESARVWGSWDPLDGPPPQYNQFATWVTARFLARHPELVAVRIREEHVTIEPGAVVGTGTYAFEIVRRRR